jgi:hypothetical protein
MLPLHALGQVSGPSKSGIPLFDVLITYNSFGITLLNWVVVAIRCNIANCSLKAVKRI